LLKVTYFRLQKLSCKENGAM